MSSVSEALGQARLSYLNTDAPFLARINGNLTAETVNEVAAEYLVRRNLGKENTLGDIADHFNNAIMLWPGDLVARAQWCLTCAADIKTQLNLHHTPCSAVTKLAWFLRPTGWTLYDSFARKAVRSGGLSSSEKLTNFYNVLNNEGFLDAADQIEAILSGTPWSHLNGARVLDTYMMLIGGFPFRLKDVAARQGFLNALPANSGVTLSTVAARIEADLAQHQFIRFVEQR